MSDVDTFERLPPHSVESEMCLIGSMMLDQEFARLAAGSLSGSAFYLRDHAIISDAILSLVGRNKPCDAVILRDELKASGNLDQIGGAAYIAQILASVPSAAHGPEYLDRVMELSRLRLVIASADQLIRLAYTRAVPAGQLCERATTDFVAIASRGGAAEKIETIAQTVAKYREALHSDRPLFVPTGLDALDAEIGGIRFGLMHIIGSRPSVGKTTVAKNILRNIAKRGIRCGIVSIEEQGEKIVENEASALSGIDNRLLANRQLTPSQRGQVNAALDELSTLPIFIQDTAYRLEDVLASITAMRVRESCDVVVVDHLHLIETGSTESRAEQIRRISGAIKQTFKNLRIGGVVLCQLNRDGNERPTLRALREGGALEQDGDVIVMLHSEDYHRRQRGDSFRDHRLDFLLQKNKSGRCADIPFFYNPATFTVRRWEDEQVTTPDTPIEDLL